MPKPEPEVLQVAGREVTITNPDKVFFPRLGVTKRDMVEYYLAVADGALRGVRDRPMALKRFVNGAEGEAFFQKRAPDNRPDWLRVATLSFPSGRTADEIVLDDAAGLAWIVNLGCIDLNPHPVRSDDLDHPDELRVDLDPVPGVEWAQIRDVAMVANEALEAVGLVGWPKTSGSRGIHVNVRIERRWTLSGGPPRRPGPRPRRRAAGARPIATSKWWKEERHGVFLDYNQNAKDRTVASAYSVRPLPDARVSTPAVVGRRCRRARPRRSRSPRSRRGSPRSAIRAPASTTAVGSLEALLELSRRDEAEGLGDAPWPPNYRKQAGEPPRVQPSKQRRAAEDYDTPEAEAEAREAAGRDGARGSRRPKAAASRGRHATDARPGGAARRSRSSRSRGRRRRRRRSRVSSAGRCATRRPPRPSSPPTCWSTGCAAARRSGTASGSTSVHVPEADRPAQEPLDPDYDPWAGYEWPDRAGQLERAPRKRPE